MLHVRICVILFVLLASTSDAFLSAPQRLLAIRSVPGPSVLTNSAIVISSRPGSTLLASNKKGDGEPKEKLDWGKIAGLFLFPGNPYAWFVYFFAFIIIAGSISGN